MVFVVLVGIAIIPFGICFFLVNLSTEISLRSAISLEVEGLSSRGVPHHESQNRPQDPGAVFSESAPPPSHFPAGSQNAVVRKENSQVCT